MFPYSFRSVGGESLLLVSSFFQRIPSSQVIADELLDELKVTLPTQENLLRCLIDEDANGHLGENRKNTGICFCFVFYLFWLFLCMNCFLVSRIFLRFFFCLMVSWVILGCVRGVCQLLEVFLRVCLVVALGFFRT